MTATNRPTRTDIAISQASAASLLVNITPMSKRLAKIVVSNIRATDMVVAVESDRDAPMAETIVAARDAILGLQRIPSE